VFIRREPDFDCVLVERGRECVGSTPKLSRNSTALLVMKRRNNRSFHPSRWLSDES
jgi:hypothetical protein